MIVGGYAVGLHGYPRYTGGIEFWIRQSDDTAEKMLRVMSDFGFSSYDFTKDDFLKPDDVIQLGYPPFRIDIVTSIDGVVFDECLPNKVKRKIGNLEVNFIGFDDLIKNKKSSDRDKDKIDVKNLQ